ncbi:sigma factor-like helix-turn-helix DNA-binding protein [Paenibacillus cisolokensis]|uniref:sigma factor-like helix-turn-helix DNA-binding protein n=1 Tax=Paenibacillus cisolokensis TaxID=1658519 RepID=UPI003D281852
MESSATLYDSCRAELKRIAWRLQYGARKQRSREVHITFDISYSVNPYNHIESVIYINQLFDNTLCETEKYVLKKLIFEDKTEKEIAKELNISQQGVSKWKKKALKKLSRMMSY